MGRKAPISPRVPRALGSISIARSKLGFPGDLAKLVQNKGWAKQNWQVGVGVVGTVVPDTPTPGHKTPLGSGIDGDDFSATSTHQQHPFKALSEHFKEFHVCRVSGQGGSHRTKATSHPPRGTQGEKAPHYQPLHQRIQFSSPSLFLGGPGMFRRTRRASCDRVTMTSLSFTAVCIRRTLD